MKNTIVEVRISFELTDEMVDQILVTAFDGNYGGSLYWATVENIKMGPEEAPNGMGSNQRWIEATIKDEDGDRHFIGAERIGPALKKFIEDDHIRESCLAETINSEATDFDAGEADHIIQLAIWGTVMYG